MRLQLTLPARCLLSSAVQFYIAGSAAEALLRWAAESHVSQNMSSDDGSQRTQCATHGMVDVAFVCQHLGTGEGLGVVTANDGPGEAFHSWCSGCDALLAAHGFEWDDETEAAASPVAVCINCYHAICRRNAQFKSSRVLVLIVVVVIGTLLMVGAALLMLA